MPSGRGPGQRPSGLRGTASSRRWSLRCLSWLACWWSMRNPWRVGASGGYKGVDVNVMRCQPERDGGEVNGHLGNGQWAMGEGSCDRRGRRLICLRGEGTLSCTVCVTVRARRRARRIRPPDRSEPRTRSHDSSCRPLHSDSSPCTPPLTRSAALVASAYIHNHPPVSVREASHSSTMHQAHACISGPCALPAARQPRGAIVCRLHMHVLSRISRVPRIPDRDWPGGVEVEGR